MKKGFTLIELLAVIVILSIIVLVATPIVLDIIEDTKKMAFRSSAYGLIDSARFYYMENGAEDNVRFDINNSIVTTEQTNKIVFDGKIQDGTVLINTLGNIALCVNEDNFSAYKNYNDTSVKFVEGQNCDIPAGYSIVYLAGTATVKEYTNQELTDIVLELQSEIAKLKSETSTSDGNPIGTVISYMGNNVPTGYLSCDGAVYNISEYPILAEQIKAEFGSYNYFGGDGTTTFAVPDLRGEFLRGTGTNTHENQGSGSSVGKHQDATTQIFFDVHENNIGFRIDDGLSSNEPTNIDVKIPLKGNISNKQITIDKTGTTSLPYNTYTSRPTNTSVLYCIKY